MHSVAGHGVTTEPGPAAPVGALAPAPPAVRLALFGKHPAWRDFVAVNPTEDNLLSSTYEDVYCRCLTTLQSGVWGDDPAAVVPHFHHAVVRLWPAGDVVVGVLAGSADMLGRQQPLLLAACCRGVCYHRAIPSLMPALPGLARRVRLARADQEVEVLLHTASGEFGLLVQGTPPPLPNHAGQVLRALLDLPELAASGEGLHRIVYQLIGHDASAVVGPWETPRGFADLLPAQVRIGMHSPEPAEAIEQWLTFARFLCGRECPLTLFASLGRTWGDLIVGSPTETGLAAILRLPEGEMTSPAEGLEIPAALLNSPEALTHCVPFSLDDPFREAVARIRQQAMDPPTEPIACLEPERSRVHEVKTAVFDIGECVQSALGRLGKRDRSAHPPQTRILTALGHDHRLRTAALLAAVLALFVLAVLFVCWVWHAALAAGQRGAVPADDRENALAGPALAASPGDVSN